MKHSVYVKEKLNVWSLYNSATLATRLYNREQMCHTAVSAWQSQVVSVEREPSVVPQLQAVRTDLLYQIKVGCYFSVSPKVDSCVFRAVASGFYLPSTYFQNCFGIRQCELYQCRWYYVGDKRAWNKRRCAGFNCFITSDSWPYGRNFWSLCMSFRVHYQLQSLLSTENDDKILTHCEQKIGSQKGG